MNKKPIITLNSQPGDITAKAAAAYNDDQLVSRFLAESVQPVADDGFSQRVMDSIAELQTTEEARPQAAALMLVRWNFWLDLLAVVACGALLLYTGFFGQVWDFIYSTGHRILIGIINFDPDDLLVRFLLFLRRLPDMAPQLTQLLALALTASVLLLSGAKKLVRSYWAGSF